MIFIWEFLRSNNDVLTFLVSDGRLDKVFDIQTSGSIDANKHFGHVEVFDSFRIKLNDSFDKVSLFLIEKFLFDVTLREIHDRGFNLRNFISNKLEEILNDMYCYDWFLLEFVSFLLSVFLNLFRVANIQEVGDFLDTKPSEDLIHVFKGFSLKECSFGRNRVELPYFLDPLLGN